MDELLITEIPGSLDDFFDFLHDELNKSTSEEFQITPNFRTDDISPNATASADLIEIAINTSTSVILPLILHWLNQKSFNEFKKEILAKEEPERKYSLNFVLMDNNGNKTTVSCKDASIEEIRKKVQAIIL
ncbi:MAG: hypothetical protein PVI90_18745 [Desulfobacteraceae bacterium]|jgi:hypothetical protein